MILNVDAVLLAAKRVPNKRSLESLARVNPQANAAVSTVTSMISDVSNIYAQVQLLKYGTDGSIEDTTDAARSSYQKSVLSQATRSVENALNVVKEVQASVPVLLTDSITEAGQYESTTIRREMDLLRYESHYYDFGITLNLGANQATVNFVLADQFAEYAVGTDVTIRHASGCLCLIFQSDVGQLTIIVLNGGTALIGTQTISSGETGNRTIQLSQMTGEYSFVPTNSFSVPSVPQEVTPPTERKYLNLDKVVSEYVDSLEALKLALDNL